MTPPIFIDCEGSHADGCAESRGEVMCSMCGNWYPGWDGTRELPGHQRQDIIAMIDRCETGTP
jgi:hypothetical protein